MQTRILHGPGRASSTAPNCSRISFIRISFLGPGVPTHTAKSGGHKRRTPLRRFHANRSSNPRPQKGSDAQEVVLRRSLFACAASFALLAGCEHAAVAPL